MLARLAQGACAGIIQPLALSVIYSVFPPEERGKAMGMFGGGVMLGPALGPIYGGFIIDTIGWRYVFTASLPFMLMGAAIGWRYLPVRTKQTGTRRLNWLSLVLVIYFVCFCLVVLHSLTAYPWRRAWDGNQSPWCSC